MRGRFLVWPPPLLPDAAGCAGLTPPPVAAEVVLVSGAFFLTFFLSFSFPFFFSFSFLLVAATRVRSLRSHRRTELIVVSALCAVAVAGV